MKAGGGFSKISKDYMRIYKIPAYNLVLLEHGPSCRNWNKHHPSRKGACCETKTNI